MSCSISSGSVVRGPGAAAGARHHGAGAAGERAGRLPPGRHALPAGLLPGQDGRSVLKPRRRRPLNQTRMTVSEVVGKCRRSRNPLSRSR